MWLDDCSGGIYRRKRTNAVILGSKEQRPVARRGSKCSERRETMCKQPCGAGERGRNILWWSLRRSGSSQATSHLRNMNHYLQPLADSQETWSMDCWTWPHVYSSMRTWCCIPTSDLCRHAPDVLVETRLDNLGVVNCIS